MSRTHPSARSFESDRNPWNLGRGIETALLFALVAAVGCRGTPRQPVDKEPETHSEVGATEDASTDAPDVTASLDATGDSGDTGQFDATTTFPSEFLFGTATSGFQVEMGCPTAEEEWCRDPDSDWYQFTTAEATRESDSAHVSGDHPSMSAGFWETYDEDLRRASRQLHSDAFRMSIEWSRLFPEPTDEWDSPAGLREHVDERALERYRSILEAARDRGLEPVVTVNHYTLPTWLHDGVACHQDFDGCERRGWLDRKRALREIEKYARFLADTFGDDVDRWVTVNEPMAVVLAGYVRPGEQRSHPPAVSLEFDAARRVFGSMIQAHARMYDAIHEADGSDADGDGQAARVGLAANFSPVQPANPDSETDREAAENVSYLFNRAFVEPLVDGEYDPDLDGEGEVREDLEGRLDWVGVNYYATLTIEGTSGPTLPDLSPLTTFNPFDRNTQFNRPEGMETILKKVNDWWDLPILVTENGTTVADDGDPSAGEGAPAYIVRHLEAVADARDAGVEVEGYLYWSLLDTFEWNRGMHVDMGLFGFDPSDPNKERHARPGAEAFGRIADQHAVTPAIRADYLGPSDDE